MEPYLECSEYIDWEDTSIMLKAKELAYGSTCLNEIAKKCFEFVRDEIRHSWDFQLNPVTCKASEVLHHGTGYCFAKSHLLAALLRANNIAAGLRYQRLSLDEQGTKFCLHGLNAIYLERFAWYTVDARGDKQGVETAFCPPTECLAFSCTLEGEMNISEIYSRPLDSVVNVLTSSASYLEVNDSLPDMQITQG